MRPEREVQLLHIASLMDLNLRQSEARPSSALPFTEFALLAALMNHAAPISAFRPRSVVIGQTTMQAGSSA